MPCQTDVSPGDHIDHYLVMLCKACKYLTPEQIDTLSSPVSGLSDGIAWYAEHLMSDYKYNVNVAEKAAALKELERLGFMVVDLAKSSILINIGAPS